jgi:hypothetical protein
VRAMRSRQAGSSAAPTSRSRAAAACIQRVGPMP